MADDAPDAGTSLFTQAQKEYPYLADKDVGFAYTPDAANDNKLEFYGPGEAGDADAPRPATLPLDKPGIQVYHPDTSTKDILADYVSHYAVNTDPALKALNDRFQTSMQTPQMQKRLQDDYAYENPVENGKPVPFNEYASRNRIPAYFRGGAFDQWPQDFVEKTFTPEQMQILNAVRQHVGLPVTIPKTPSPSMDLQGTAFAPAPLVGAP